MQPRLRISQNNEKTQPLKKLGMGILLAGVTLLTGCGGQDPLELTIEPHPPQTFQSFDFEAANNPQLRWNVTPVIDGNFITSTLPYGSLVDLVPTFEVPSGSPVYVNSELQTSGATPQNFSQSLLYIIKDANGGSSNFQVNLDQVVIGGNVQVSDLGIGVNQGVVTTLVGDGGAALLNSTHGLTFGEGALYFTEYVSHKIRKYDLSSGILTTLAGSGVAGFLDGTGTAAAFNNPSSLVSDGSYLYIVDASNTSIRKLNLATNEVTTLAGSSTAGSNDGTGTAARFNGLNGITYDGQYLYVAEQAPNHRIRRIDPSSGEVTTFAGDGAAATADGIGRAASFNSPHSIVTDGRNLYVSQAADYRIRKVVISTGEVITVAGDGNPGLTDGIGTAAQLNHIYGLGMDRDYLYFSEDNNGVVRKMHLTTFEVSTLVGSGTPGFADGTGTAAQVDFPRSLASDGQALYLADYNNNRIRKITP